MEENSKLQKLAKEMEGLLDTVFLECDNILEEMKKIKDQSELELHKGLAKERAKWEDREEQMAQQLKEAQGTHFMASSPVALPAE